MTTQKALALIAGWCRKSQNLKHSLISILQWSAYQGRHLCTSDLRSPSSMDPPWFQKLRRIVGHVKIGYTPLEISTVNFVRSRHSIQNNCHTQTIQPISVSTREEKNCQYFKLTYIHFLKELTCVLPFCTGAGTYLTGLTCPVSGMSLRLTPVACATATILACYLLCLETTGPIVHLSDTPYG